MVPLSGHWKNGGWLGRLRVQEVLATEAGVTLAAVRIEDSERRPPAGWAGPVAGDDHLRSLADDVPSEANPRSTGQLEADSRGLADGSGDGLDEPWRLQDHEADPGPPGEGRQPAEAVGDARGTFEARREVDDEEVHGPAREQRAGDREALVGVAGREDHEPLRPDAASDGLHRIERRREVHPGHDRARGLGLGDESQGERRPAAREVTSEREAHPAGQAPGPENRIEGREPGREDARRISLPCLLGTVVRCLERHHRERPHDVAGAARRGRSPLRPQGRQGRRDVRGKRRHRAQYRTSVRMNQGLPQGPVGAAGSGC
jgi:hypothetical protein